MSLHEIELEDTAESDEALVAELLKQVRQKKEAELMEKDAIELVNVGVFEVPGVRLVEQFVPDSLFQTMTEWANDNKCGDSYDRTIWYFRSEEEREQFLGRFTDEIESSAVEAKGQGFSNI